MILKCFYALIMEKGEGLAERLEDFKHAPVLLFDVIYVFLTNLGNYGSNLRFLSKLSKFAILSNLEIFGTR